MTVLAQILVLFGAVLMVISAIGVVRFRDVLARMHALTKASTLGLLLLLGGSACGLHKANDITSLVLAMALQLLTLPIGVNLIAKATYEASAIQHQVDVVDELADRRDD